MLLAKIEKNILSGHGIENNFFPIDLKFNGSFFCISATKICLNSATVLTSNSSSSCWHLLYLCTFYWCWAKPFEFLNSFLQVKQVELLDWGSVIEGIRVYNSCYLLILEPKNKK